MSYFICSNVQTFKSSFKLNTYGKNKELIPASNEANDKSVISGVFSSFTDAPGGFKEELQEVCVALGEKKFRAKQLWEWLWQKGVTSFDDMSNLSKSFRESLKAEYTINGVRSGAYLLKVVKVVMCKMTPIGAMAQVVAAAEYPCSSVEQETHTPSKSQICSSNGCFHRRRGNGHDF